MGSCCTFSNVRVDGIPASPFHPLHVQHGLATLQFGPRHLLCSAAPKHISSAEVTASAACIAKHTLSCSLRDSRQEESAAKAAAIKLNQQLQELVDDLHRSSVASEAARDAATTALQDYHQQVSVQQAFGFCCPAESSHTCCIVGKSPVLVTARSTV